MLYIYCRDDFSFFFQKPVWRFKRLIVAVPKPSVTGVLSTIKDALWQLVFIIGVSLEAVALTEDKTL
jgi:hypothetical protein